MPEEQFLILHMHELLQYLNRQGASTFLTVAQHGLVGDMKSPVDVTYLADTVILLRNFGAQEAYGPAREYHPRAQHWCLRDHDRSSPRRISRGAPWRTSVCRDQ